MSHYIGLDAHSKTCTFVVIDQYGRERRSQVVSTCEKEIRGFLGQLDGKKVLTFEESTLARWLYAVIKPEVDELVVCNPLFLNRKRGQKNDFNDALHLAQQLRGGFLESVYHSEHEFMKLRTLVSAFDDITEEIIRTKCRYSALLRSQAITANKKGTKNFYQDEDSLNRLEGVEHQFVAKQLMDRLKYLDGCHKNFYKEFRALETQYPEIRALATIPGIAMVRAVGIVAHVCVPERFPSKYHFWSYCGLVSHDRISDGKSYGKIRRGGLPQLKTIFIGAAETAKMHFEPFRELNESLMKQGLDKRAARRAIARKLATTALSIMKSKKVYDPAKLFKNEGVTDEIKSEVLASPMEAL